VIDRGLESWTAAAILSLIGLFNIFGSLLSGYSSTKISKKIILSFIYSLRGLSIILFIFLPASNINSFIFGASFGFLWLSTVPATSGIVAHMFETIPYNIPRYLVPNMCATIPLVAGTVDNHKKPKLAPNKNALILLAGVNIKRIIEMPLKK
jgi:MFS family permease